MTQLTANQLVLRKALNGPRAVYSIAKHPKLYLAADGKGGGSWRIKYRPTAGATQRWVTISNNARHVEFDAVVRKATELLTDLSLNGVDPKGGAPSSSPTFGAAFEQWLERYAKPHKKSWKADADLYRRNVAERFGSDELSTINRGRVISILNEIAEAATPIQANRCQTLISSVFSWALDEGMIEAHPALRIRKRGAEKPRDQVMTDDELRQFWHALEGLDEHVRQVLKLLLLLGSRLNEIVGIEFRELHLDENPHWVLPSKRSKNDLAHTVPLPTAALEIICAARDGRGESAYLFPARFASGDAPFDKKFVSRLCKRVFRTVGREDMRLHDLRHQAATGMARCGVSMDIRQLVQNQVTGRHRAIGSVYDQHDYFQEKKRALELWERRLLAIVEGREAPAERY